MTYKLRAHVSHGPDLLTRDEAALLTAILFHCGKRAQTVVNKKELARHAYMSESELLETLESLDTKGLVETVEANKHLALFVTGYFQALARLQDN
jgi:RIO-like serine/threonine protein kinase